MKNWKIGNNVEREREREREKNLIIAWKVPMGHFWWYVCIYDSGRNRLEPPLLRKRRKKEKKNRYFESDTLEEWWKWVLLFNRQGSNPPKILKMPCWAEKEKKKKKGHLQVFQFLSNVFDFKFGDDLWSYILINQSNYLATLQSGDILYPSEPPIAFPVIRSTATNTREDLRNPNPPPLATGGLEGNQFRLE